MSLPPNKPWKPSWPEAGLLLDAQLNELADSERQHLDQALVREPRLRSCHARLGKLLDCLRAWNAPPCSAHLVDRVMARVALDGKPIHGTGWKLHAGDDRGGRRNFLLNLHELAAIAACVAVFVGVALVCMSGSRFNAQRLMCAGNLRNIYSGTAMYAASFGGFLPNAGSAPGSYWLKDAAGSAPVASNSSHQYLLLRAGFVTRPETFVCAARAGDAPIQPGDIAKYRDFPSQNQCSYDAQNMTGPFALAYFGRRIPYQSDANPLFDGDMEGDPQVLNSRSHDRKGQNVLHSDGSVIYARSPLIGPIRDNIWQAGNLTRYVGNETPTASTDVFMVPGGDRTPKSR